MKDHSQGPTPHLFVYGSSVGREVAEPLVQGGCVLDGYVARQSLISALRPADPRLLPRLELPSPFLQRMWDGDVAGSLFPALSRLDPGRRRLVVWDLIDERLGVYELPDGSYLTRSVELMRSRRDQEVAALGRHLPFGSDEHFHVWCAALDLFCRALQDAGVPEADCVLLALPWAQVLDDGTPAPASYRMTAAEANRLSARYHQQVREQTGLTVVAPDPGELIAARDHRGGPAPFHFTEQSVARLTAAVRSVAGRPEAGPLDAGPLGAGPSDGAAPATGETLDEQVRLLVIGGPEVPDAGPVTTLAAVRQPVTCAYGRFIRDEHPVFPALMGSADEVLRQQVRGGLRAHVARFAGRARLVVIDLNDEVHGCYEIAERTYLSRTATRSAPELDATLARDHRLVEFGSAEHLELWRAGLRRCRAEAEERGPDAQVVVLRCADDEAPAQLLDRYAAVAERERITVIRAARRGAAAEALAAAAGAAVGESRPATPTDGSARTPNPARTSNPAPQVLPAPPRPQVVQEELGTVDVVSVRKVAAYRRDGELLVGALVDGRPARFVEVRLRDGAVLRTVRDDAHRYGSCVLGVSTGAVYGSFRVPNDGVLWRLDPGADRLVAVANQLAGESVVRALADDRAGGVFVTTYPGARLVHVRASGEIADLGPAIPGAAYAWNVAEDDEGVWVGSGPQPAVARIARYSQSGAQADAVVTPLPAAFCLNGNFVTHLVPTPTSLHVGVTFNPSGTVRFLRLDRGTGEWSMSAGPAGREVPAHATWDAAGQRLWFVAEGRLWSAQLEDAAPPELVETPGLSVKELSETTTLCAVPDLPAGPASVVVGVSSGGRVWALDPAGQVTRAQLDLPTAPAQLHQVGATHAGTVLASVFNGTGEFGVVGEKGLDTAVGLGQVEATAPAGDRTYVGVYPDVAIHELSEDGVRHVVTLGREASGQDRPLALCVVRDELRDDARDGANAEVMLAVGTAPTYGRLGGAVVLLSLERGRRRVRRRTLHPVPGQAVTALTVGHSPGKLVGGTGVEGGLGAPENRGTATLFRVDGATDLAAGTVGRVVPIPVETRTVGALCLVPDGVLALTVDGDLVLFEPDLTETRTMLRTGLAERSRWGMRCALLPGPAGTVVGLSAGKLFRVDAALSSWEILCTGVRSVAALPNGNGPDGEGSVPPGPRATGYVVTDGTAVTRLWVPDPNPPTDAAGDPATDPGYRPG